MTFCMLRLKHKADSLCDWFRLIFVWSRQTSDGALNVRPTKCQWELKLHICPAPSQPLKPTWTGARSLKAWRSLAGGDQEAEQRRKRTLSWNATIWSLYVLFFNPSQDWKLHPRHGVPPRILPTKWEKSPKGSVCISGCHFSRQCWREG